MKQSRQGESTRPLRGMIVIRPKLLDLSISDVESEVQDPGRGVPRPIRLGEKCKHIHQDKHEHPRPFFFLIDDYVIDVPRTMFSLLLCAGSAAYETGSIFKIPSALICKTS